MPSKVSKRKSAAASTNDNSPIPQTPTLSESLSYLHYPRPFKNPNYTKNNNRRTKNLKTVLTQERERERTKREARRQEREEKMEVDDDTKVTADEEEEEYLNYTSIEAPPSILPHKHFCDITGLEAPYTDPATGLRYHDKSIYDFIKRLNASTAKEYLAARGVNPIVK